MSGLKLKCEHKGTFCTTRLLFLSKEKGAETTPYGQPNIYCSVCRYSKQLSISLSIIFKTFGLIELFPIYFPPYSFQIHIYVNLHLLLPTMFFAGNISVYLKSICRTESKPYVRGKCTANWKWDSSVGILMVYKLINHISTPDSARFLTTSQFPGQF
jgi:hypothetical protein